MPSPAANGIKTGSLEGGDGRRVEVDDRERVQRVAIHPHDLLLVDGRHGAFVEELPEGLTRDAAPEVEIAFGTTSMAIATYPTKPLCGSCTSWLNSWKPR